MDIIALPRLTPFHQFKEDGLDEALMVFL